MHADALKPHDRAVIIDDVLATGGTCEAICNLIKRQNCETVGLVFLLELLQLNGKLKIKDYNYYSLLQY